MTFQAFSGALVAVVIGTLAAVGCRGFGIRQEPMNQALHVIADPGASREALLQALRQLGPVEEPPEFWTKIANSTGYSPDHRRRAVFELFRRHVHPPIAVAELARLLHRPTWLRDEDVSIVSRLGGKIPVKFDFADTVFVIGVLPDLGDGRLVHWSIYLRVRGHVDRQLFVDALRAGASSASGVEAAPVLEYGLSPADPASPTD
jgi:hypothetical protein